MKFSILRRRAAVRLNAARKRFRALPFWYARNDQMAALARATPAAMLGYAMNATIALAAFWSYSSLEAILAWALLAYGLSGYVLMRSLKRSVNKRKAEPAPTVRSARQAIIFGVLLALPWAILVTVHLGEMDQSGEMILIALTVGMAASGTVMLAPVPAAACVYMTTILLPVAVHALLVGPVHYMLLGGLAVSFWVFLLALILTTHRLLAEKNRAVFELESSVREITMAREEIERVAMTDALTGLANRRALLAHLEDLATKGITYVLFYLDLDRFKSTNDTLGHSIGDELLKEVAARLCRSVRPGDLVARLGGDEFAIVAKNLSDRPKAISIARRVLNEIVQPCLIQGNDVTVGSSIGIVLSSECKEHDSDLLKCADIAMYEVKASGRNGFRIYETAMQHRVADTCAIEMALRHANMDKEFELHFQPFYNLRTLSLSGFEALIRWNHPSKGLIGPAEFLPLAEELGLMGQIGGWVLDNACNAAVQWPNHLVVSVNFAPAQIASPQIVSLISRAIATNGLRPQRLELEITEASLLQNHGQVAQSLRRLKALGVSIAMDDFGTGYSSLSYLVSFPFDKIKVDKLFVSEVAGRHESDAIVSSIVQLGRTLNCATVAEGIETSQQLQKLRALGITHGQGYYFSKPLTQAGVQELIAKSSGPFTENISQIPA